MTNLTKKKLGYLFLGFPFAILGFSFISFYIVSFIASIMVDRGASDGVISILNLAHIALAFIAWFGILSFFIAIPLGIFFLFMHSKHKVKKK